MMNAFSALMEARDPVLGRFRSYRLEAGSDLFGTWQVEVTYGRIGTPGRRLRYVADDQTEARKIVQNSLRRRATARKRIGVSYCFRELAVPWQWLSLTADTAKQSAPTPAEGEPSQPARGVRSSSGVTVP
jgi:hypothetical protein